MGEMRKGRFFVTVLAFLMLSTITFMCVPGPVHAQTQAPYDWGPLVGMSTNGYTYAPGNYASFAITVPYSGDMYVNISFYVNDGWVPNVFVLTASDFNNQYIPAIQYVASYGEAPPQGQYEIYPWEYWSNLQASSYGYSLITVNLDLSAGATYYVVVDNTGVWGSTFGSSCNPDCAGTILASLNWAMYNV
ncbi:MAG TPA: hypothetical protein VK536_08550, partial [Candidatus Limnocylindrales bacterium]|nr:hypothetical protein [Candidatus Limnocylindrales bacterium]